MQYLVEAPLQPAITALSVLGLMQQALHSSFGDILPLLFADPLKLCQVGRGPMVNSRIQV